MAGPIRKVGEIGGKVGKQVGKIGEKVGELGEDAIHAVEDISEDVVEGFKKLTRLHLPQKSGERPLKRSKTGYETELFLIDSKGDVTDAGWLIDAGKARNVQVTEEAMRSVAEVLCLPHHKHQNVSSWLVNNLVQLSEIARERGCTLYPYATYIGEHATDIRRNPRYTMLQRQLGRTRFMNGMRCCGYHQHYTLPRGLFDPVSLRLRYSPRSKLNRTLLDSYNFLTAANPAITCLMQSSPYINGERLGKDARMIVWEGDPSISGFSEGMFRRHPSLSTLGPYHHTLADLRSEMSKRYEAWKMLVEKSKGDHDHLLSPEKRLSYNWGPLKINPKGTLEYRGPDMNLMSNVFAVSTMIKFALRKIQQDFALVTPLDIEINDAFRLEGNMLFIPPYSVVRERLWHASAYEGLENRELRRYVQRLYRFSRTEIMRFDPAYLRLLKPAGKIIDNKKTVSDRIIAEARKAGCGQHVTPEFAREFALRHSDLFLKDLHNTKDILERTEGKDE